MFMDIHGAFPRDVGQLPSMTDTSSRTTVVQRPSDVTLPPPQVWLTLRARDAQRLIRFLIEAFGFEETAVYREGEVVNHAQLSWPLGGGVMLGSVRDGGGRTGDHGPTRDQLRLARLRGAGPRRQSLVVRHLSRRAEVRSWEPS
jgi:hypothetical protein